MAKTQNRHATDRRSFEVFFANALENFFAARYTATLETIEELIRVDDSNAELELLFARTLMRLDRYEDAIEHARRSQKLADSVDTKIIASAISAFLSSTGHNLDESKRAFQEAEALTSDASVSAKSEFAYFRALNFWQQGSSAEAERIVEDALDIATGLGAARLLQLRGWIEVRKESYRTAAEDFLDALDFMAESALQDMHMKSRLLHALAIIASETIDLRLASDLEAHLDGFSWAASTAAEKTKTLTCLHFLALLADDKKKAWLLARSAIESAPDNALKAIAATNAAALSSLVGDKFSGEVQLDEAWAALNDFDWSQADEERRVALTNFSIVASASRPSEARVALTRYISQFGKPDVLNALHGDRRLRAFEEMAAGRVSEVLDGHVEDALAHYRRSLELWTALDYRMRAALVAKDLYRLSGDARDLEPIAAASRRAPNAWFRSIEEPTVGSSRIAVIAELPQLTKAQRRVLTQLLTGKKAVDIANALELSVYTIHNHTRKVFEAFGVHSKAALMARISELGLNLESISAAPPSKRRRRA